ncbi:hypothetical protein Tco_0371234 [Tanacetum coccineum]
MMLKVSPWKGVVHFGKKGKLALRYVGPFEILERIGPVAYRLRLSEELSGVHDTFYVSNLKKCLADASLHVPLDEIKVDKTLRFVEEHVEIMDREIKSLKRSKISLMKVRWNSKHGPEYTWQREDYMKSKYPQLFVDHADESASVVLCDFMCTKWFTYVHDVILEKTIYQTPNIYKEYLAEFWYSAKALENSKVSFSTPTGGIYGEVGINTFRNAIGAHYLPHPSGYVEPPSIDIEDIIIKLNKKHKEKVVPYTRFLSLVMMHEMKEGYRDGELTLYPTQVFSVNNWALKPNQPEEPPFPDHMLAICAVDTLVVFKAPKTSSKAESVFQGTKPRAKPGHKNLSTSLKQPSMSSKEVTKGGSFKAPTNTGMHKEDKQATGGPTSLGVTSEARATPQLSSGMSAFNLNESIYSASFIIHSESASRNNASAVSTAEADPGKSAPSRDPHVLADQTKSVSEGLETVLTQPITGKGASSIARQVKEEEASNLIKLEDLLSNQVLIHQSQKHKLKLKKNKAEAEIALLKAQPSFPNVGQLNDLLIPGDLKEIPSKLEDFTKTITSLTSQVVELKTLQLELLAKFVLLLAQVASVQAKLKTLDALLGLLLNFTKALNNFAQVLDSASSKAEDQSVPSAGQDDTMPAAEEKNTNQATISQLFQTKAEKNAEKENLNNQQPKPTTPPATTIIPPIITTTTTQIQSPP